MGVCIYEKTKLKDFWPVFFSRNQEEATVFIVYIHQTDGEHNVFFRSLQKEIANHSLINDVVGNVAVNCCDFLRHSKLSMNDKVNQVRQINLQQTNYVCVFIIHVLDL